MLLPSSNCRSCHCLGSLKLMYIVSPFKTIGHIHSLHLCWQRDCMSATYFQTNNLSNTPASWSSSEAYFKHLLLSRLTISAHAAFIFLNFAGKTPSLKLWTFGSPHPVLDQCTGTSLCFQHPFHLLPTSPFHSAYWHTITESSRVGKILAVIYPEGCSNQPAIRQRSPTAEMTLALLWLSKQQWP